VDKKEITVIIEQDKIRKEEIIEIEKDFRVLTFDMRLPFNLVGFIARISNELAKEGIPILVISSYSTDHILLKEKYLSKAIKVLRKLGFKIENV